jgi:serine/threonine protein kinase/dipeptidyl aminopeptidase/acylaminoacyl peptidase
MSDTDRHSRVMEIVGDAFEVAPEMRRALVDSRCGNDPTLKEEVERLLAGASGAAEALPSEHGAITAMVKAEMASVLGQRIGAYEFLSVLGQGGMGVVYKGRDTRLGRDVAIKMISPALAGDATRLIRFTREARVLASLSHPNIATVYGLEESGEVRFLVMELMAGDTLASRIKRAGSMTIPEALNVCAQIATGLEAAHDLGVVHRDLKPGNVMYASDGKIKVLDFGLAREITKPAHETQGESATDLTMTMAGAILGTPAYMSPEQLRSEPADRGADVFAFGCVLYECLTGKQTFPGNSTAQIVAAVLEREPDWSAIPSRTPDSIRRLLRRCLAKDQRRRLRDLGDARIELEDALTAREWLTTPPTVRRRRKRIAWLVVTALAVAAVVGSTFLLLHQWSTQLVAGGSLERFSIPLPGPKAQNDLSHLRVAISRDGRTLVCSAFDGQKQHLWVRRKGDISFSKLDGTEGAWIPSLSPDGQRVTYFLDGALMKGRTSGGTSYRICNVSGYWGNYCWGTDGMITFVPAWGRGLARINAEGGALKFVSHVDYANGEFAQLSPFVLPDNRTALVTVWDGKQALKIVALDMQTGTRKPVVENATSARVAATPLGNYLLFERANTIYAAPFDVENIAVTGSEVAIVDGVMTDRNLFHAVYDVADDGTLVYIPGTQYQELSRLVWLGDNGATTPFNEDHLSFAEPNFSADGNKLLVTLKDDQYKAYVYDIKRGTFERAITEGDTAASAISPDGSKIVYSTNRDGPYCVWLKDLATNRDELLLKGGTDYQAQPDWSPDGKYIAFSMSPNNESSRDVWTMNLEKREPVALCNSPAEERSPRFSPSGKWLAYVSDASGVREVYVKSFPDGQQTRQITFGGGDWPEWAPDGKLLYYRHKDTLYSIPLSANDGNPAGRASVVYTGRFGQSDYEMPDYTVAPDGRVLLIELSERGPSVSSMNVVLNWYEVLRPNTAAR